MLWVVYFDDFYKDVERQLQKRGIKYKLVHCDNIHANTKPSALIICGSKKRILREQPHSKLKELIAKTMGPVIGICYGFQYLALLSGGTIIEDQRFKGIRSEHYYNHHDKVVALPSAWNILETDDGFISVASNPSKNWFGTQFHPEKKQVDFDKYVINLL